MFVAKLSTVLLIASIATKWTLSSGQKRPSFVKKITLKVEGQEECVRTSEYIKPASGPCKDFGECYQYRCGAIGRHCSACGEYKGPCVDYSGVDAENTRKKRSLRHGSITSEAEEVEEEPTSSMTFMESITSRMRRLVEKVRAVVQTVPSPQPVPIETIGDLIVHLRAGERNCTGFITFVNTSQGRRFMILTAAQCLINFETECSSGLQTFGEKFKANESSAEDVDGFTVYPYKHSWPCFGDYDADVTKVKKSFRSYAVVVTPYFTGPSYTIPLDSEHIIVPRNYMECQDCRYDYAAIKLSQRTAGAILRGRTPFILAPDRDPMEWTGEEVTQFVSVKANYDPTLLRKAADTKFCTISYATNEKMCFNLPISPSLEGPDFLPGSPLFITTSNRRGEAEYHCIGIFTGQYSTEKEVMSTEKLMQDGLEPLPKNVHISLDMRFSRNGAVRITETFMSLLKNLAGQALMDTGSSNVTDLIPQVFPPRRDCFPNVIQPYNGTEHLFLCSLGWKSEKDGCIHPDFRLSHGCTWDMLTFKCDPKIRRNEWPTGDPQESIFQQITLPGTTRHLSLRGQHISDVVELSAALSHLPILQDLLIDYNEIEVLDGFIFKSLPELRMISLKYNKVSRLNGAIFRHNKKLRHINLSHNQIKVIPANLLGKALVLQNFYLEHNDIGHISPRLFGRCPKLERLNLGFNNMSHFSPKVLKKLGALREFRINNNKMKRIALHTFAYSPQLSLLDLSHNALSVVPRSSFDNNPELRYVNLNYNDITVIPRRLFAHQSKLFSVFASKNPLLEPNRTREFFEDAGIPYS